MTLVNSDFYCGSSFKKVYLSDSRTVLSIIFMSLGQDRKKADAKIIAIFVDRYKNRSRAQIIKFISRSY